MKLKDALNDYEKNHKEHDFLSVYYRDENERSEHFTENHLKTIKERHPVRFNLLIEADIKRYEPTETEYTYWNGPSHKCICYSIEIDADQAKIALGCHPALKRRNKA